MEGTQRRTKKGTDMKDVVEACKDRIVFAMDCSTHDLGMVGSSKSDTTT